jgi:hypothetical protein
MPGLIWCLGMRASASTWLYNAVREVVAALAPAEPIESGFAWGGVVPGFARRTRGWAIVKSHETDAAAIAELSARAAAVFVSLRDPRDAIASLMTYEGTPFPDAVRLSAAAMATCAALCGHPQTLVLRYEDGFAEQPMTLAWIAAQLGWTLPRAARDRIFSGLTRAAVEQRIKAMAGEVDHTTHWHKSHAGRTGEVGRWQRVLADHEAALIEAVAR